MQHCGICSVLADLFRRIMCIGGSRRGSSDSYYQELDEEDRRGAISVDRTDQNAVLIRMVGPLAPASRARRLSDGDRLLLEALDTRRQRPLHSGRFLTMHKRRRRRLTTRCLQQEPALLDDVLHGQAQCVLERVSQWPFNAFTLDTVTGGRSLPVLCVHLFHWYGLIEHFNLDVVRVWKLFTLIEEGYHSTNPYHNSIHATDVTQAMHCFLQEDQIRTHVTPLEIMSSLIAAVTHDLDHPGVNQPFLIATSNHLAALYENTSVLENHHWRSAIGCLLESSVAEQLGPCRSELERQISSLILATDITRQQEFITRFKRYLDQNLLDMRQFEDRHFILQIALKCADISNPCRPWDISRKWSHKVCEEFFRQGDYERRLNLPVTSLCDRRSTSVPKIQAGFFRFVVSPLAEEWHRFLGTDLSRAMMGHLRANQERWEAMVRQEVAEETRTEVSEVELPDDSSEGEEEEEEEGSAGSVELLLGPASRRPSLPSRDEPDSSRRVGRRHSVPLSLPAPRPVSRTVLRRESLPEHPRGHRRFPSGPIEQVDEEGDLPLGDSSLSLLSSGSGGPGDGEKRPASAENLLPEPSIASITTSREASRLCSVLRGGAASRRLARQQTFPPPQPHARARCMSTTAEMARCALRDSNRTGVGAGDCGGKREQGDPPRDKGGKVAKLAEAAAARWEKENLDPQRLAWELDFEGAGGKTGTSRRNISQVLARRRGSAPVGLLSRAEDNASLAVRGDAERYSRRGSVPIDVTRQSVLRPVGFKGNTGAVAPPPRCMPRRSSLPYDLVHHAAASTANTATLTSLLHPFCFLADPAGAKEAARTRGGGKQASRRRSSGGPEMCEGAARQPCWRDAHKPLERRRGSLPAEVLADRSSLEAPGTQAGENTGVVLSPGRSSQRQP
ncbi:uncharacterized protein LOC134538588 [Bacillus rossius redtenbacheri]|uniref:uncharacterized protein LOC134538588 n=1 Tax=Bacillus rossius redtenbacheri TaxID=93214 RepID=UPI002FDD3456